MKTTLPILAAIAGWSFCSHSLAQTPPEPEIPSIWRTVVGIDGDYSDSLNPPSFTHPHMPGVRTSADGRIGLICEGSRDGASNYASPRFVLLKPESLDKDPSDPLSPGFPALLQPTKGLVITDGTTHTVATASNPPTIAELDALFTAPIQNEAPWAVGHVCMWDDGEIEVLPPVQGEYADRYTFWVVNMAIRNVPNPIQDFRVSEMRIFATQVHVVVRDPKSKNARIESVETTGLPQRWSRKFRFSNRTSAFEPVVAADGRLLVFRLSGGRLPNGSSLPAGLGPADPRAEFDTVYLYNSTSAEAFDPAAWREIYPISSAFKDVRINGVGGTDPYDANPGLGIALHQFRDSEGRLIPPGEDFGGNYPWIDRDARNLLFTGVRDSLYNPNFTMPVPALPGPVNAPRFPTTDPGSGHAPINPLATETDTNLRGMSIVGLWTRGKVVNVDTLNNDQDYSLDSMVNAADTRPQHRHVKLYRGAPQSTIPKERGEVLMGYGRTIGGFVNGVAIVPFGENDNGNIIDSFENRLNHNRAAQPVRLRDVVWTINNSKWTDELVFDDYTDPNVLIFAEMTGSLRYQTTPGNSRNNFLHGSGWDEAAWDWDPRGPRIQNSSCSDKWRIPTHGYVVDSTGGPQLKGRIEPVAMGGVHGRGFWLDGDAGLAFDIQPGPKPFDGEDWYFGVFLDSRFGQQPDVVRRLLTFPDGSTVDILDRKQLEIRDAQGIVAHRITLPADRTVSNTPQLSSLVPDHGWCHLAFERTAGGEGFRFILNGLPYARWTHAGASLFGLDGPGGRLTVGQAVGSSTPGVRGWIDELKVISHLMDAESACNHAGGTLVGIRNRAGGDWEAHFADRFPDWAHQEITATLINSGEQPSDKYVCFFDFQGDRTIHQESVAALGANFEWKRQAIQFPEGPLFHDLVRPTSTANKFCLSCHSASSPAGLGLDALLRDPLGRPAHLDPRRQPLQPPREIDGYVPAGMVDTVSPAQPLTPDTTSAKKDADAWVLPSAPASQPVASWSLIGAKGEVAAMRSGTIVDPVVLGFVPVAVRANLASNQGSVQLKLRQFVLGHPVSEGDTVTSLDAPYAIPIPPLVRGVNYQVLATPEGGRPASLRMRPAPAGPRPVAHFSRGFRSHGFAARWRYAWNDSAGAPVPFNQPAAFAPLAWRPREYSGAADAGPEHDRYSTTALPISDPSDPGRLLSLGASHGHPGNPGMNLASMEDDRCVLLGYEAPFDGRYSLRNLSLRLGPKTKAHHDGVELRAFSGTQSGPTHLVEHRDLPNNQSGEVSGLDVTGGFFTLHAGDFLWLAIGANGSSSQDDFTNFDFDIVYQ